MARKRPVFFIFIFLYIPVKMEITFFIKNNIFIY